MNTPFHAKQPLELDAYEPYQIDNGLKLRKDFNFIMSVRMLVYAPCSAYDPMRRKLAY